MPKLRNSETDIGKFVQLLGRKCRNHHPLQELGLADASSRPNVYNSTKKGNVLIASDNDSVLYYKAGGRIFELAAREIKEEEIEEKNLIAVGY
jgi:hypothetical protein